MIRNDLLKLLAGIFDFCAKACLVAGAFGPMFQGVGLETAVTRTGGISAAIALWAFAAYVLSKQRKD